MAISNTSFSERLQRIEQSQKTAVTHVQLHHGDGAALWVPKTRQRKRPSAARELGSNASYLGSIIGAFLIGGFSVGVGMAMRGKLVPYDGLEEMDISYLLLGGVISLMASFALAQMFRFTTGIHKTAQTIGVLAGISLIHNLAFWVPDYSAQVFTPDWVALQHAHATPNTIMFRGLVLPFAEPPPGR